MIATRHQNKNGRKNWLPHKIVIEYHAPNTTFKASQCVFIQVCGSKITPLWLSRLLPTFLSVLLEWMISIAHALFVALLIVFKK